MTQQDKELLLKDLPARLLCGVKVKYESPEFDGCALNLESMDVYEDTVNIGTEYVHCKNYPMTDEEDNLLVKPYLRSISNMNKVEESYYLLYTFDMQDSSCAVKVIDWLNENHFDYRGLIGKGIALEAPDGMYNQQN